MTNPDRSAFKTASFVALMSERGGWLTSHDVPPLGHSGKSNMLDFSVRNIPVSQGPFIKNKSPGIVELKSQQKINGLFGKTIELVAKLDFEGYVIIYLGGGNSNIFYVHPYLGK